ncbi:MAG TPA: SDR family NAD(P)-dependent oxidoreductase, partial [Streptosporangiaceae bacterium]
LSAVVHTPGGQVIWTGRLSLGNQGWLAGHAVNGAILLPGTAYTELALMAGSYVGCPEVGELVLHAPLRLDEHGGVAVRLVLDPADEAGRRALEVHSGGPEWTRHASGFVAQATGAGSAGLGAWPPPAAVPVDLAGCYDALAASGLRYGPAFQGLRAMWLAGADSYAEVELPEPADPAGYTLHPALFDAALHACAVVTASKGEQTQVPFSWAGVRVFSAGATSLRVRCSPTGPGAISIAMTDQAGLPVAEVDSLTWRPLAHDIADSLYVTEWHAVPVTPTSLSAGTVIVTIQAPHGDPPADARAASGQALSAINEWLAAEHPGPARLVIVTCGAVATATPEPASAAVWGLVRSAQAEHAGQFVLIDAESAPADEMVAAAVATGEPSLALRDGSALAPRLMRLSATSALIPPRGDGWRLAATRKGTIDDLVLTPRDLSGPLPPGQVRVRLHAAGLNFRDVLIALGMYPDEAELGSEGAGIVTETGPGVSGLAPGDRVMGLFSGAFGPVAETDRRLLAPIPPGWSFEQAASVPAVYLTAYYALAGLARTRPGETVLIHAAASGVGLAAVHLARHLGADVYATASPRKWDVLRELGLDDSRIASSRTLEFGRSFDAGVDVVLNSLAGEFVDVSAGLLRPGGRFVELGKTDIRDPASFPGISYHVFDLTRLDPALIERMLAEVLELFGGGSVRLLPVRTWDVRHAAEAFRFVSQARHTGKVVLTIPAPGGQDGAVLITGGTGTLGGLVARHLVTSQAARRLILVSRRGPDAPGAAELAAELAGLGAEVRVAACDVADRDSVARLLGSLDRPLTAIFHLAGATGDAPVTALTADQIDAVFAAKADGAWNLHELTSCAAPPAAPPALVLFSSVAGTIGTAGQANYAAANAFLDALAQARNAAGLPGASLAWGLWEQPSGLTSGLRDQDRARLARAGVGTIGTGHALSLLDTALETGLPVLVPAKLSLDALRSPVRAPEAPQQAPQLPGTQEGLLRLVRTHAATVLGHMSAQAVEPGRAFTELGFDSLTSVELRNRLSTATSLSLPATLVFDHPTSAAVATYLRERLSGDDRVPSGTALDHLEATLTTASEATRATIAARLRTLIASLTCSDQPDDPDTGDLIAATDDELFGFVEQLEE